MFTPLSRLSLAAVSPLMLVVIGCGGSDHPRTTAVAATVGTSKTDSATPPSSASAPTTSSTKSIVPAVVTFDDAESAFRAGHYDDASELFGAYAERRPDNPWAFYMLGLSQWKAGKHAPALDAFDKALALDPKHLKSLLNSSRVLLELGRPEEAADRVQSALAIEPASAEAYRLLGRAHSDLGQTDEAIEAYHRAIALDDRDAWAMNNLGLIYLRQGKYGEAIPPLARATKVRSNSPVFQNNLGQALERSGYFTASKDAYQAALTVDSTYGKASVALDRVKDRADRPEFGPLDLDALALSFLSQVQEWRDGFGEKSPDVVTNPPQQK